MAVKYRWQLKITRSLDQSKNH